MTPVKNQFYCGSCYAFAATAVTEFHSRRNNLNLTLSEQNILDCDPSNYGCDGGWPGSSLGFVRDEGITEELTYMYETSKNECRKELFPPVYKIPNVCEVDLEDSEEKLRALIFNVGPVAGVIHATEALYSYGDGVLYDPTCDSNAFDHAIVGLLFLNLKFF